MAFITDTGSNKLVKAKHGYMIVNCNDQYIGESIIHYGEWYEPELDLLSQFIESRDNIIEIGSNYGSHTLRLCQLAYHGKIFAIEPQRAVFQALCGNIAINSIFNCFCIQKACSDVDNQPIIVPDVNFNLPCNFGGISMIENPISESSDRTITLDSLFQSLERLKLIKIDAEGMEEKILIGARKLIKRTRPLLFIENDRKDKMESLIREVFEQDYRAFWYINKMYNHNNFKGNSKNIFGDLGSFNMICFPKELNLLLQGFDNLEILDPKYHLRAN